MLVAFTFRQRHCRLDDKSLCRLDGKRHGRLDGKSDILPTLWDWIFRSGQSYTLTEIMIIRLNWIIAAKQALISKAVIDTKIELWISVLYYRLRRLVCIVFMHASHDFHLFPRLL